MSKQLEQALREYRAAVARSVASHEAQQGSEPQETREKSKSAYQASRGAYQSDDVRMAWTRYTEAWAEEGTGAWFAPFASDTPTILVCSLCKLAGIERVTGQKEHSDTRMLPTITRVDGDTICEECVKAGKVAS